MGWYRYARRQRLRRAHRRPGPWRPLSTLLLCALLVVVTGESGTAAVAGEPRRVAAHTARHRPEPAPGQRWGTAAGAAHVKDGPRNTDVPASLRSRYPLRPPGRPAPARNAARTAAPPTRPASSFDPRRSRELPERRQARQRTYANPDGTETTEFATEPLNVSRPDGTWAPVDTTLAADAAGWRGTTNTVDIRLARRADAAALATVGLDADHTFGYGLAGAAASPGRVERDRVVYPGVLRDTDLEVQTQTGGLKETLILRSPNAPPSYVFPLRLTGLTATLVRGQVVLSDAAGQQRAVVPAGFLSDAADVPATADVRYELIGPAGQPALRVSVDPRWLRAPGRRYPVRLDPSVQTDTATSAMVVQNGSSRAATSELTVGRSGNSTDAAYLKFGNIETSLRDHTIYGAQLQIVNYEATTCSARTLSVHPVTQAWTAGGGFPYPGPSVGAALDSESFNYGFIATGQSQSGCPAKATLFDLGKRGRDLVQGWVSGRGNNGLSLRASATDTKAWKRIAGPSTPNGPKLYVTHSPYNASYTIPNPVPTPPVLANQDGKVKVTVTNLGAEAWRPGAYYLAYRAYRVDTGAAVTQQRSADLTTTVARNGRVTLDATIKRLPRGRYFLDFTMVKSGGVVFTDQQVPPGRIVLEVFDVAPVFQEVHPPNGYQAPTLTPQLWTRALDIDATPGSTMTFSFELCERTDAGTNVNCATSPYAPGQAWTVPAGRLSWSKQYVWRTGVKDATNEVFTDWSTLFTSVPQPEITSRVAAAPYGTQDREFDPQVGNLSTAAVDASVTTVGPDLRVVRTYNSLDPRRDLAFGAGWVTQFDMRLTPDNDGSGNVVVTYSDGQQVRYGRNPDGTFAAPTGRTATLTQSSTSYTLADRGGVTYQFSNSRLVRISDAVHRAIVLTYDTNGGRLARAQVSNSQTNTAGRSLFFTWGTNHIASVRTDPVNGVTPTWTYTYTGDLLTRVCATGDVCTAYEYAAGSHYRGAVLDSRPESYYRLGEPDGTAAGSEIAVNLGKDAGTARTVTLGAPGALTGTDNTAATFNGSTSAVDLPSALLKKNRDAAVELWFRISPTQTGGPLIGYQDKALGTAATAGVPILYVGTDGRLRGQFRTGAVDPITSTATVNNNLWHHVVLSVLGDTQTLFLDGDPQGTRTRAIDHSTLTFNQIGAAYATTPASWPGWGSTPQRSFSGSIDEVAVYAHPLGDATVKAHRGLAAPADQLAKVTMPSGRVALEASYDAGLDRIREYTDRNGGTWKIGAPAVFGGDTDLRRTIAVLDPADRPFLYEYDALAGRLLRSGSPLGLGLREEDRPDYRDPDTTPTPSPTELCNSPDPGDERFCTVVPGSSGGPVFDGHSLDGMAIRSFSYDPDTGLQTKITNENGDHVELGYDARGNVSSKKTCRTATQCFTSYTSYPATVTNPLDPRNDLPTETRDGRSTSSGDNRYLTTYSYTVTGELAVQTNPDRSTVRHTYTAGTEVAVGGGIMPAGLLFTTTDARNAVTRYAYYGNGDLAQVTEPSGMRTTFGYDALGRRTSQTEISDSFPGGVTTTFSYDALSRVTSTTGPVTTDAVDGRRHQQVSRQEYDPDGNVTLVENRDALVDGSARVTRYDYDDNGRMSQTTDAEGVETTMGYDRFGNRVWMVDPRGIRYEYAFTARNAIAEVRLRSWRGDPDGAPNLGSRDYLVLTSYAYDYAGRMVSQTDSMGRTTQYSYFSDDLVDTITLKNFHNPDGTTRDIVVQKSTYDGAGHELRQEAGNGRVVTENTINAMGQVQSTVTDPQGVQRRTSYEYDPAGNVLRSTTSGSGSNVPWPMSTTGQTVEFGYDAAGHPTKETVLGSGETAKTTTYRYDQRGLLIAVTDPRGNVAGADPAAYTSTFRYDEMEHQVATTGPAVDAESGGDAPATVNPTATVSFNAFGEPVASKDPLGNISRTSYDRMGRPVLRSAPTYTPAGGLPVNATTETHYDEAGNVVEVVDPRQNVTRYTFDQLNRMTVRDEPATTNSERAVWRYTYTRTGDPLSVTDPTGARQETTYDDLDRPVTATSVERRPVADTFTTRYTYDDAGNLVASVSPGGARSTMVYNGVGELLRSTTPAGVTTEFGYDLEGRQVRMSDGLGRTSRTSYDSFGRMSADADLDPAGTVLRTQQYAYDPAGNLVRSTDALQHTTEYTYNALNQLVKQVEPATGDTSITTSFGYDAAGNRTRYTDGRGNSTIFTVNSLGLPDRVVEPATPAHPAEADRTWSVSYDIAGQPVQQRAPGGVTRQRNFDAAGRLTQESGAGAPGVTQSRQFGYDLADRLTTVNAPNGSDTYNYSDRGLLLSAAGPGGTAAFGYNADGQQVSRTDAAGTASFAYTNARLTSTTDATGTTQKLGYDPAGLIRTVDYGAGRLRTYGYDAFGRVASDVLTNNARTPVASIRYQYNLDDRMTRKTTTGTAGAADNTYDYDLAGRLTSWKAGNRTTAYAWDAAGNRTRAGDKTATYDARNRLIGDGDYTYAYTARGTLESKTSSGLAETFSFDAFDRLIAGDGQTYDYDGLGRVASRNGVGFSYAGQGEDPVADGTESYSRGPDDDLLSVTGTGRQRVALTDEHGDLVGGFDPKDTTLDALSSSTAYDPFGEQIAESGATSNLGFQGDWTDPATDQVAMGARWYDPNSGTFDSRDTVSYSGGDSIFANRYTYGAGDPLDNTDPDGNWPSCGWCKRAAHAVSNAVSSTWNTVSSAASSAWRFTVSVARTTWNIASSAVKRVVHAVSSAARWVYSKARSAASWVSQKVSAGAQWLRSKAAAAASWARQKAAEAKRAAVAAAKAVTKKAKAAVAYAVKHNPLPAIKAALKPVFAGIKQVVSASAHVAAAVVSTVRDVVDDNIKAVQVLYQAAVAAAGTVVETVSKAADAVSEFVQTHKADIAGFVAGAIVGLGCEAAIGITGVGAVACGALAGAVGSFAHDLVEGGHSWKEMAGNALIGGAVGGLTGGLMSAAAPLIGAGTRALGGAARSALPRTSAALSRVGGAARNLFRRGCTSSFVPGTAVLMANGTRKAIEDVKVGDLVLATDPTTGRTAPRRVTEPRTSAGGKTLTELTIDVDGAHGSRTAKLTSTANHPYWAPDLRRWVDAGQLAVGNLLRTSAGTRVQVTAVKRWTVPQQRVHNLTVDGFHTYYVVAGNTPVLVHNCPGSANAHLSDLPIHESTNRFNVRAGELVENRVETHPLNPDQMNGGDVVGHGGVRNLSNDELIMPGGPQGNDPIRGTRDWAPGDCGCFPASRVVITGGHHRTAEVARRVMAGEMDPSTLIEFVISPP